MSVQRGDLCLRGEGTRADGLNNPNGSMVLYTLTTFWLMTVSGVWALCVASARGDRAVDVPGD